MNQAIIYFDKTQALHLLWWHTSLTFTLMKHKLYIYFKETKAFETYA